jgi:RNA polymerase sigma factor (sigma-70 family)
MSAMQEDRSGDLVARWRAGDQEAAGELHRRYTTRLIALARSRLPAHLTRRLDPEDVVQSVYRSFFAGAGAGRYDLQQSGDLWQLLVTITLHKLYRKVRQNSAAKRAVGREQPLADAQAVFLTHEPTPAEAAALADELQHVMRSLEPVQQRVLEMRLQGCNLDEIAADLDCSERTVIRLLQRIKHGLEHWPDESPAS